MIDLHSVKSEAWPEADQLFKQNPIFRGGDDAYSIELSPGRILWLFGDSFLEETGTHRNKYSRMVKNCVGIQDGSDPASATLTYTWRGEPGDFKSFFADHPDEWLWPGHGALVDGRLLLFFFRTRKATAATPFFSFEHHGWNAQLIENPQDDPIAWKIQDLGLKSNAFDVLTGSGPTVVHDGWVYSFGSGPGGGHLCRWTIEQAASGHLQHAEWWCGSDWIREDSADVAPACVIPGTRTEFGVAPDPSGGWLHFQNLGIHDGDLISRWAPRLEGPWSDAVTIYRMPENERPEVATYSVKAHPHLPGADLVLTYNSGSPDLRVHLDDESIYYPRFVRLTFGR